MAKLTLSYPLSSAACERLLLAGYNHGERQTIVVLSPNHEEPTAAPPTDVTAALQDAAKAVENGNAVADLFRGLAGLFSAAVAPPPDTTTERVDEATWERVVKIVLAANGTDTVVIQDYGIVGYEPDLFTARDRLKLLISEKKGSLAFDNLITAAEFCDWFEARTKTLTAHHQAAVAAVQAELNAALLADARRRAESWLEDSTAKDLPVEAAALQAALDASDATTESLTAASAAFYLASKALEARRREADRERQTEAQKEVRRSIAEWAEAHGSGYLKGLAAIGADTETVYKMERLALELPGWTMTREAESSPYRPGDHGTPSPTEVENALRAREAQPQAELRSYYLPIRGRTLLPTVSLPWAPGCAAYRPLPVQEKR